MLRISLVLAALCLVAAPAVADTPSVSVVSKKTSWKAAPKQPAIQVKRQPASPADPHIGRLRGPDGITLVVRWGGAVCNATWTTDGTTVRGELNVDAPATRSCTITLALAPWPTDAVDVQIDAATPRHLTVPAR